MSETIQSKPRGTATRTMQAATVVEPGRVEIRDVSIPQPKPGEVRVCLEGCGVCASNLAAWEGHPWFHYPLEPGMLGHEGWGHIDTLGDGVTDLAIGQRVAILSGHAYAQYDVAPASDAVPLPATLADQPFPGEPLGCSLNIARRSGIARGDTVAIVGIGFLGAMLTRLFSVAGARVIAISRRPYSLDVARRMGAAVTVPMDDHYRIIEQVKELTAGRFCDVVIEAIGRQWPLDLSAELTRERGRLVVAGYHQDGPRQINMQLWNWRGLDVINAHERDPAVYVDGIRTAAQAVATGLLDPSGLYRTWPLRELAEAFNATRDRPDGFLKALVAM
jgi:threonine dehydrogenase-like Zn-dependent dehydrogenase